MSLIVILSWLWLGAIAGALIYAACKWGDRQVWYGFLASAAFMAFVLLTAAAIKIAL